MDGVRNILRRMVDPQIRIDDLEGLESLSKQRSSIITTVAPWQIWYALHRDGYLERLLGSDHYLVDGNGIVAALRVAGAGSVPRFTGREAAQAVYEGRLWADSNVAVLGGSELSHDVLRRTHPNWLVFGGEFSDRPAESKVESVVEFFKTAGIDRVLLGLGT